MLELRNTILAPIALVLLTAGATHATCLEVGATATAAAINSTNILGVLDGDLGRAGLLGAFPSPPTPNPDGFSLLQEGRGKLVFANPDDQLRFDLSTTIVPVSAEAAYLSSVVTIRSGSGKYAGATGTLLATGEAELATSKQVLRFRGEICTNDE